MKRSRSDKLEAGQFRFLNEVLYTTPSSESQEMFKKDPEYFHIYHRGFAGQIQSWPVNPLAVVEEEIRKILIKQQDNLVITDLGCGLGQLELNLKDSPNAKVFSYDLVSAKEHVISCDIAKLPLRKRKVDIAVFCLSLMGVNHVQMVQEAHRVLKRRGTLIVAEVSTRFVLQDLLHKMRVLGFKSVKSLIPNSYFSVFIFQKVKPRDEEVLQLFEPCKYKKR